MVHVANAAIEECGIDGELIDLRSIVPLDIEAITESVKKTGRCVIACTEASRFAGFWRRTRPLWCRNVCFWNLKSLTVRVTGWDTPYPRHKPSNGITFPGTRPRDYKALKQIMEA